MSDAAIWGIIAALGVGTFLIRYSFLGLIGDRQLPPLAERLLRYVPVAVLPALVTPLVLAPQATDGAFDPARALAAVAALSVGAWRRSTMAAIAAGMGVLLLGLWLFG
ncbi:AzlD domain-containing protein [Amaricoccus macauensis]|uniref:AzlD domain-containing protein n=1 Tax=Amaricoccus macauensis TaxID=57001 RepID=UPI003C7A869E